MKAILCKYLGPSDTKGARIKASAEGVPAVVISYPHELGSGEEAHKAAALELCKRQKWDGDLLGGELPDGTWVFCFDDGRLKALRGFVNSYRQTTWSGNPWSRPEFKACVQVIGRAYGFNGDPLSAPTTDAEIAAFKAQGCGYKVGA